MRIRFKLLTWNIEEERIFSRNFKNFFDAIQTSQILEIRRNSPHDILHIFKVKKTGHKWNVAVWNIDKPQKLEYVSFYSKKDAIFAIKVIKEYNDTLKVNLIKQY